MCATTHLYTYIYIDKGQLKINIGKGGKMQLNGIDVLFMLYYTSSIILSYIHTILIGNNGCKLIAFSVQLNAYVNVLITCLLFFCAVILMDACAFNFIVKYISFKK